MRLLSPKSHRYRRLKSKSKGSKDELLRMGMLPIRPQKLVVLVHGGPKDRDRIGFNAQNVWLTSRGYAVLQVKMLVECLLGKSLLYSVADKSERG